MLEVSKSDFEVRKMGEDPDPVTIEGEAQSVSQGVGAISTTS